MIFSQKNLKEKNFRKNNIMTEYWTKERLANFYTPPEIAKRIVYKKHNIVANFLSNIFCDDVVSNIFKYIVYDLPHIGTMEWDYQWWRLSKPYYISNLISRFDYSIFSSHWQSLIDERIYIDTFYIDHDNLFYIHIYGIIDNKIIKMPEHSHFEIIDESPNKLLLIYTNENELIECGPRSYIHRSENTLCEHKLTLEINNDEYDKIILSITNHTTNINEKFKHSKKYYNLDNQIDKHINKELLDRLESK
jgi:hypothetical protein